MLASKLALVTGAFMSGDSASVMLLLSKSENVLYLLYFVALSTIDIFFSLVPLCLFCVWFKQSHDVIVRFLGGQKSHWVGLDVGILELGITWKGRRSFALSFIIVHEE